jgi:hypothetical protein
MVQCITAWIGYGKSPHSPTILSSSSLLHPPLNHSPGYNEVLGEQLQKFHGSIDEVSTIHDILPTVQTGNLHIAFYDLTDQFFYVSLMRKTDADETEPHYAYERQFTKLSMKNLFETVVPTVEAP